MRDGARAHAPRVAGGAHEGAAAAAAATTAGAELARGLRHGLRGTAPRRPKGCFFSLA